MALSSGEIAEIRGVLNDFLPWSPRDFMREMPTAGDRRLFAEQLTSEMTAAIDLRMVGQLSSGRKAAVFAEVLPWDSAFFGYGVARLDGVFLLEPPYHQISEDYSALIQQLLEEARQKGVRYLFASVDPRDLALMRTLGILGFSLIETRVYYHMAIKDFCPTERFPVRAAVPGDIPSLGKAAQVMVNEFDRFHADPFIQKDDANKLMYRWIEASVGEKFADITIVPDREHPAAFCTVKYHRDKWPLWGLKLSQPVFSAVSSEFRGWYRKLISEVNCNLRDMGAEHSYLATQITNKAVVRVWESLGYRFGKGEHIFRIVLKPGE